METHPVTATQEASGGLQVVDARMSLIIEIIENEKLVRVFEIEYQCCLGLKKLFSR